MYFYLWIIVLIVSILLEFLTAEAMVCIWFVPGSLVALIFNQMGLSLLWQMIAFFLVSLLCLCAFRPLAKKYLRGNIIATNADRMIHVRTRLLKGTREDVLGEVKINGIVWNVRSMDEKAIEEGSYVEVLAIEGSKLIVKAIDR